MGPIIFFGVMIAVVIAMLVYSFVQQPPVPDEIDHAALNTTHTWQANAPGDPPPTVRPPPQPQPRRPDPAWDQPPYTDPPAWRDLLSPDPIEHSLLAGLRSTPGDPYARMVYADWLEEHGELVKATFVRGVLRIDRDDLLATSDLDWRAITSRERFDCMTERCPPTWANLGPVLDDERLRLCPECGARVRYCGTSAERLGCGIRGELTMFDPGANSLPEPK